MVYAQTMEKLVAMKLHGMAQAYDEQRPHPQSADLSFDERFAMLIDRQWIWKEDRALTARLKYAQLKQAACLEDLDYRPPRGLSRALIDQLASCQWIRHHHHCLITGPTGAGKSFVACALAHKACREGYRALYYYIPKLFRQLDIAQADGSLTALLKKLAKVDLLLIDDWGLSPLSADQYRLFLEILEDRQGTGATLLTSQYPLDSWHQLVEDPTVGDAILDRLLHNAFRIELKGESMRQPQTPSHKDGSGSPPRPPKEKKGTPAT